MKKQFLLFFVMYISTNLFASSVSISLDTISDGSHFYYCSSTVDTVIVYEPINYDGGIFFSCNSGIEVPNILILTPGSNICWVWINGSQAIEFYIHFVDIEPSEVWIEDEIYKCSENSIYLSAQSNHQDDFTYLWNTGYPWHTISVDNPGTYSVTITGACGVFIDEIEVINYPIPQPDLGPDMTNVCSWDHKVLDPGPFNSYNWSTGENTQQITVSQTAEYSVTVTDANGCKNSDDVYVHFYENPGIEISTVSVDTVNGNNKIVWNTNIPDFYNNDVDIYRNGTTNELTKIATVPYMQGYFTDEENSSQRTWRYAITAKDNCENHSNISLYHESMKISLVGLIGNAVKVEWTPYTIEGDQTKSISSYKVFSVGGFGESWIASEIATIPGTQTSYNLPLTNDSLYVVGAILNNGGKNPGENMALAIMENPTVTRALLLEDVKFALYPNPSTGPVNVNGVGKLEIINSLGQIVLYDNINGETTISLPKGAYIMKLTNNNITHTKKFIIIE